MPPKFSLKELTMIYKRKSKNKKENKEEEEEGERENEREEEELITGKTIKERIEKLSYLKGLRELNQKKEKIIQSKQSIAICLVIVDELRHEQIWKEWIEQGNLSNCPYQAELYIHAKYPDRIQSEWARSRTLDHSFLPEWNSPEVIRAMLAVLEKALTNSNNCRFVFGTESCIPICSLIETGDELFSYDVSWADTYHIPKNSYEEQYCFYAVNPSLIPNQYVWKALPGWIMITRRHAEDLVKLPSIVDPTNKDLVIAWNTVHAPEEVYFPTLLAILGYLRDTNNTLHTIERNTITNPFEFNSNDEVWRRRVCFAEWKNKNDANPINYTEPTIELFNHFRSTGCLFARKFPNNSITVEVWRNILDQLIPLSYYSKHQKQHQINNNNNNDNNNNNNNNTSTITHESKNEIENIIEKRKFNNEIIQLQEEKEDKYEQITKKIKIDKEENSDNINIVVLNVQENN